MTREDYARYLAAFNARDYDAVLEHYAPDGEFELIFFGQRMTTRREIRAFYAFFHAHVREEICVHRFLSDAHMIAMEATVRVTGLADLTPEVAAVAGFEIRYPLLTGQVLEVPQFIHYHLEGGKFTAALCAAFEPPASA